MKRFLRLQILLALLLSCSFGMTSAQRLPQPVEPAVESQPETEDTSVKLQKAASYYAIIQILLDEGDVTRVPEEFQKILDLGLTGDNERQIGQAAWKIVHRLSEQHQYALAHMLVKMTLERVELPETQFSLLMLQAKVYQAQRLLPQAIATVRRAQEILNQGKATPQ